MGYSITQERGLKLDANRREGRLCRGATTALGGCANKATVRIYCDGWNYETDKLAGKAPNITAEQDKAKGGLTVCKRHVEPVGYEGANFTVVAIESY